MPSLCRLLRPRQPTSGSVLSLAFCIDMSSSGTTGSSFGCIYPVPSPTTLAFDQRGLWSRHFQIPHPPILVGGSVFEASLRFTFVATCRFARPPVGADQVFTQPTWTFTSGLPTDWSPAPPPDITTVATGQVPPAGLSPASMPTSIAATPHRPHRADFPQRVPQTGLPALAQAWCIRGRSKGCCRRSSA